MRAIKLIIVSVSAAFCFVAGTAYAESIFDADFNQAYIDIDKLRAGSQDALDGFELHGLKKMLYLTVRPKLGQKKLFRLQNSRMQKNQTTVHFVLLLMKILIQARLSWLKDLIQ